jgi:hypothetical protein
MSILILSTLKDLFTSLFSGATLTDGAIRPLSGSIRLQENDCTRIPAATDVSQSNVAAG